MINSFSNLVNNKYLTISQVNIVKKMLYIWVKNVVVFINQRAIFPVSEARFKLSLFLFFLLFLLKCERYVVDISCCVTQLTCASN